MAGRLQTDFVVDPGPLGARLRRIRTDRGVPIDGVDGVGRSTLEQIERGRGIPSLDTAIRLADAFGCTLDGLIGRDLAGCEQGSKESQLPPGSADSPRLLPCCGGFAGEHFDSCSVGADIAAARWAIARSEVLSP